MTDPVLFFATLISLTVIFALWWALTDLRKRAKERRENDKLNRELVELLRKDEDA